MSSLDISSSAPRPDTSQPLWLLRSLVERMMTVGKISSTEATEVCTVLIANSQVISEEMAVIRTVMQQALSDRPLKFE